MNNIDRNLDIKTKLTETEAAISALASMGMAIPPEAIELRTIMARAIAAEAVLHRIAYEPYGHAESTATEVLDAIVLDARSALAAGGKQ